MNVGRLVRWTTVITLGVAGGVLIDWSTYSPLLSAGLLAAIAAVQPMVALGTLIGALRLRTLAFGKISTWSAFKALLLSNGLNTIIPGRICELVKATYLRSQSGLPFSRGIALVIAERCVDLIVVGGVGLAIVGWMLTSVEWLAILVVPAVAIFVLAYPSIYRGLQSRLEAVRRYKLAAWLPIVAGALADTLQGNAKWRALALGSVLWANAVVSAAIFFAIDGTTSLGIVGASQVVVASALGGAIPLLPAGIGTYEAAVVFVLLRHGYETSEAIVRAIALHASQVLLSVFSMWAIVSLERIGIQAVLQDVREYASAERLH